MKIEYLEDFESIKDAFLSRFVLSWEDFQVRSKEWIEKMGDRGWPVDTRWYDQAFLWDKMDPAYAFTSFQDALAYLREKGGTVLFMTEKMDEATRKREVSYVARADAVELSNRIEEEWFEMYRLLEEDMYNPDALPCDIYVFDQTMNWCVVFTHETSDVESELDDPMKAAESRCCIVCKSLYCYAAENKRIRLASREMDEFEKDYYIFLELLWDYMEKWKSWENADSNGPYKDPDVSVRSDGKYKRRNPDFYSDLCAVLNKREAQDEPGYAYDRDDEYLHNKEWNYVTDQFGFSAPGLQLKHPYDTYLIKCKKEGRNKEETIRKVIRWVTESRTIGGAFLWPVEIYKKYNSERGGADPFDSDGKYKGRNYSQYYLEDRVDLTLLEIKHAFDYVSAKGENPDKNVKEGTWSADKLYTYIVDQDSRGFKWFSEMGSFDNYVKLFCFEDFVNVKDGVPIDILLSDLRKGEVVSVNTDMEGFRCRKEQSIFRPSLGIEDLERMFENINIMIKKRSRRMQALLERADNKTNA